MAVNCAILSYNGTVYFGFSGDVHAAPDLRRLETLLMTSFTELRDAVGIRPPQKKKVRRKQRVTSTVAVLAKAQPAPVPTMSSMPPPEPKRVPAPASTSAPEFAVSQSIVA